MILYWSLGRNNGFDGSLIKFFLQYWNRYLGLIWHIFSVGLSTYYASYDYVWAVVNPVAIGALEYLYYAHGADAIRYVDPDWTYDEASLLPFKV